MTIEEIKIRSYLPTDYAQVKQILKEHDMYWEPLDLEERWAAKIKRDPESIIVATKVHQVIGTVMIQDDGRLPWIWRLAVKAEEGKGLGAQLLQEAEQRLKQRGYPDVHILVWDEDPGIKGCFEADGYQDAGYSYRWMSKKIG